MMQGKPNSKCQYCIPSEDQTKKDMFFTRRITLAYNFLNPS